MSYQAPEFLTRRPGPFIVCRLRPALAMTGGTVGADVSEIRALGISGTCGTAVALVPARSLPLCRHGRCPCVRHRRCYCVMAGLGPATHDFAPSSTASRGW